MTINELSIIDGLNGVSVEVPAKKIILKDLKRGEKFWVENLKNRVII